MGGTAPRDPCYASATSGARPPRRTGMLVALRVKNLVLLDELELRLAPGFNALTGETGAGKSIVVGALALVLGGRASADVVRVGRGAAEVEALFDVTAELEALAGGEAPQHEPLRAAVEGAGGGVPPGHLALRRVVQAGGRSRAYLNGRPCAAAELLRVAPLLADVASQHESVALTDPSTHLAYLDRFGGLSAKRGGIARRHDALVAHTRELLVLRERARASGEREAALFEQLEALARLAPEPGELVRLEAERARLRHATRLGEVSRRAAATLDQADGALCDTLGRLASELRAAAGLDPALAPTAQVIDEAWTALREASRELARYAEGILADPARLEQVEERLYRLGSALRRHGPTLDDLFAARERMEREVAELRDAPARHAGIAAERDALLAVAAREARELSRARRRAAERLGEAIGAQLGALGMGGARVVVEVEPLAGDAGELSVDGARLGRDGIDRAEFLIAPNPGIDPRPLRRIASGGELSRALLALKRALADSGPAGLYVFDEVDAGVGGAVAERIGQAIADVSRHRQVLCITHLAPIAALADAHFVVRKSAGDLPATSAVIEVRGTARVEEVARMLAGERPTPSAVRAAAEMLAAAGRGEGHPGRSPRGEAGRRR